MYILETIPPDHGNFCCSAGSYIRRTKSKCTPWIHLHLLNDEMSAV